MYNNNTRRSSSPKGAPSYNRYSGNNGNNRNRSYGNNRGGRSFNSNNGRSRFRSQSIDALKFVKKAVEVKTETFVPVHKFADFDVVESLKHNIAKKGYVLPTPIQDSAIPLILEGKDVIGIANTGTGKTAAFLIPLINKVLKVRNQKVLIILPTRELAVQIKEELLSLTQGMRISSVLAIGGADIRRQIMNLKREFNFLIATPGRLKDLAERRAIYLEDFNNVVLDEVDRMLDMGFLPEIKYLISEMAENKQSLFFSATLDEKLKVIANSFLNNPEQVSVRTSESADSVDQDVVIIKDKSKKIEQLSEMLVTEDFSKVLVFSRTKKGVERLHEDLARKGHKVESIHGNKSQFKRQNALDQFKNGRVKVLIATDVMARGIDVADISHVINYDVPATYEDYIHRIGRTGRGGKKGKALTFIEK